MTKNTWENNYKKNRFNRYPFSEIITYTMRLFPSNLKRKNIKVLDLGCGGGTHANFFISEGFDYYAVDQSKKSVKITVSKIKKKDLKKKIFLSNFDKLPFKSNYFNYIIDRHSLTHNSNSELGEITKEIYRVLKNKGYFLSIIFGDKHSEKKYGVKFYNKKEVEFYHNYNKGSFKKSNKVNFFNGKKIRIIFKKFRILSLIEKSYIAQVVFKKIDLPKITHGWTILMTKQKKI